MEAFFQQLTAYFGNPAPAGSCEPGLMCFLQHATSYLAAGVEASAAVIMALAAIQATAKALLLFLRTSRASLKPEEPKTEDIRLRLGRWLALAIEFELAADILRTAISPTWNDIAQLAAIATILTTKTGKLTRNKAMSTYLANLFDLTAWVVIIEFIGALLIVAYVVAAIISLLRHGNVAQARLLVADGAITGLSFKLAGTLLKTIELRTWQQILMFVAIFVPRTVLKRLFSWERSRVQSRLRASGQDVQA